ncbi:heat-shock protein Hsp20 [Bacillus canaveralius]|uniref:Heat-shock protein Hsp20 n=1 Tax=Bacillus canaveralius TaxID=1403243 RepID=A0A2N5GHB0_9BACI|nr:Hsp20/alpha crystallin family protein [Bacillus canaveralius]PLR80104.1 heat-shock protein Hsp20 [Bacillus canaveralius]PLR91628.1 heat-shock protein Hsp20 [Bacillus canaveralius]RSK57604.1 Hsp20/alpha crystallin family protein [Bacillus canaveralius]
MSLTPFEPFRHLENVRRELDRFFTSDFPTIRTGFGQNFGSPNIDIHETENEVVATCDIPGLEKKEDVNINIDNNMLTISGTVHRVNELKEENMHRRERFVGRFQRSVTLPSPVSEDGVRATYRNGVLEIHMPKLQADNRRRIDVEFH